MPGVSCDPNGPVHQLVGHIEAGAEPPSGRTDLLVHIGVGGKPDEVRIERSSGDVDVDTRVAVTVCDLLTAQDTQGGPAPAAGWARLSIRLAASD